MGIDTGFYLINNLVTRQHYAVNITDTFVQLSVFEHFEDPVDLADNDPETIERFKSYINGILQNGRTYRPRFSSVSDGNAGYAATVTDFYFQKPDPYNSLATFTIVFSTSLNLQAKLRLSPIHAGISYIQTMYY